MKCLFYLFFIFCSFSLFGSLLQIDSDNNYDYTTIQEAIDNAENGDLLLVHPGTYYENIDFCGKQIELNSLFADTGERHYIHETVINGNSTGSCVKAVNNESELTSITGFTLTGGSGTEYTTTNRFFGGGIYIFGANLTVNSCIIEENTSDAAGGAISLGYSHLFISDTIIRNNAADRMGGGICFYNGECDITFDSENRCSIYNNFAPRGADIYSQYEGGNVIAYLDTITAADYLGYYVFQYIEDPPWLDMTGLEIDYCNTWIDLIDADIYVSPAGNDNNSGLSWNESLQSITSAMQKIAANPLDMHTIHLAEGVYSVSNTNEKFPFQAKECITLSGESSQNTIIDAEFLNSFFTLNYGNYYFSMENLRFINSGTDKIDRPELGFAIMNTSGFKGEFCMNNIVFDSNDPTVTLMLMSLQNNADFESITYINNGIQHSPNCINLYLYNDYDYKQAFMNNIKVVNNDTGQIVLGGRPYILPDYYISNLLCYGNRFYANMIGFDRCGSLLLPIMGGAKTYLINSSLARNSADNNTVNSAVLLANYCSLEVINSILYDNETDYQINSINMFDGHPVNVHHSLIENGQDGVLSVIPYIWDEETNLDCDPMFSDDESQPLSLLENSPCIDAGTTQMPDNFELPDTDIYGNPRIYGSGIDIGAVEWQAVPVNFDEIPQIDNDIIIYPNPFIFSKNRNQYLNVKYSGKTNSKNLKCIIYNTKGQKIRSLKMHSTKFNITTVNWDLKDDSSKYIGSGVYFIRIKDDNQYVSQQKVTVCK